MCATGVGVGPTLKWLEPRLRMPCVGHGEEITGPNSQIYPGLVWVISSALLLWFVHHSAIRLRGVGVLGEASIACELQQPSATFTFGSPSFPASSNRGGLSPGAHLPCHGSYSPQHRQLWIFECARAMGHGTAVWWVTGRWWVSSYTGKCHLYYLVGGLEHEFYFPISWE